MSNFYDGIRNSQLFKKFVIDDMLFVEYSCEPGELRAKIWSHSNYFTYVTQGKLTLKTMDREFDLEAGHSYFVKKGSCLIHKIVPEEFCDLIIFVPDDFIRSVIDKHQLRLPAPNYNPSDLVIPLHLDNVLRSYYQSLFSYLTQPKPPSRQLLKIKFEELIVSLLTGGKNPELAHSLANLHAATKVSIPDIMELNFCYNLGLKDFARLCARSLSTFRRDFIAHYGKPPGQWLRERRLDYSRSLLEKTERSIDDVLADAGFRNRSHFIRIFKDRYGIPPHRFRQQTRQS